MTQSMNRRMFLRGVGGSVMAIPFLPSLLSRAFAAAPAPGPVPKCFFAIECLKKAMKWDEDRFGLEYDLDIFMIGDVSHFYM